MNYHMNSYTWERILSFLLQVQGIHTKDTATLHKFIEAVWLMALSGCQWRLLPKGYSTALHIDVLNVGRILVFGRS